MLLACSALPEELEVLLISVTYGNVDVQNCLRNVVSMFQNTNLNRMTGVDWDQSAKKSAIYKLAGPGHQGWSKRVDSELGNCEFAELGFDLG